MTSFDWIVTIVKVLFVSGLLLNIPPIMIWVERRGSALLQNRLGPNRVGPFGLLQSAADAVKLIFKEDLIPSHVIPFYYVLAPLLAVIPAFMTFAVIPMAAPLIVGEGKTILFQVADLNVGVLYIFSIASLGVYGIIMAGWASNNKYALLGGLRSSAQMISYELSLGLSLIGMFMIFQTLHLGEIAAAQGETLINLGPISIPKWGIFVQPLGFLIFLVAAFAETNRLPFDLPEGESEIVAGYHLEYGAMKFSLFYLAEYVNMAVNSALIATIFFGGWQLLPGLGFVLTFLQGALGLEGLGAEVLRVLFQFASFSLKMVFFLWFYVWVRWTLPRFRYDQLMDLGWKVMMPLSLVNIFVTAVLIYMKVF